MDLLYQRGQQHSTSYLYKSGHNSVVAVVISISYVNELDWLSQW